jgi:hypothetical protein
MLGCLLACMEPPPAIARRVHYSMRSSLTTTRRRSAKRLRAGASRRSL